MIPNSPGSLFCLFHFVLHLILLMIFYNEKDYHIIYIIYSFLGTAHKQTIPAEKVLNHSAEFWMWKVE